MASKLQKSDFSFLFTSFVNEFYSGQLIYQDTLLTKTMILPNQPGSVNNFLHDVGDYIFKKENKCANDVKSAKLIKSTDFFKSYCSFINLIKVNDQFENFFATEEYLKISREIKEWEAIYGKALFDLEENKNEARGNLVRNLKAEGKTNEEIKESINDFLEWYRDPKNAGIMEDASNNIKAKKIAREYMLDKAEIPTPAMMVYDARIMCSEAGRMDAKNIHNMLVEGASFGGYFEPMIRANAATLKTIGSFLEFSKADKYLNKQIAENLLLKTDATSKETEKYIEQTKLPAGANLVNEQQKQKDLADKQAECAKKSTSNNYIYKKEQELCEIELEKLTKLYYKTQHNKEYEDLKLESQERKEKNLKNFKKFSVDEKLDQCKANNYVKFFSASSLKSLEEKLDVSGRVAGVGGLHADMNIEDSTQKADSSCISFSGVHSIPLRYPWFNKELYNLDFNNKAYGIHFDTKDFKYDSYKDFILERCIIPKSVIIGAGLRAHFKQDVLKKFDFDFNIGAEVNKLLWDAKAESNNGYSNYNQESNGFDVYEPDLLVVLGYELEDICPKFDSAYFQNQCFAQEL